MGSHGLFPEDLLRISAIIFFIIFCCILIWNIQTKIAFWNFDVFPARGIGQWVPAFPSCLRCLWVCFLYGSHWPLPRGSFAYCLFRLLFFYYFLLCTIIWNIQLKIAFWNFDVFFARGIGQWFLASPIMLTLPVGLLPRRVSWPHAWGSIACLGCQKIFTCETRVLHSTPQSLTYWLRRLPFFLMHAQACMRCAHARKGDRSS